jgi:hypothetical protein
VIAAQVRSCSHGSDTDIELDGAARIFDHHGHSSGTTALGKSFSRTTALTVSVATQAQCVALDGTSRGTVGNYDVDLTLEGFRGVATPARPRESHGTVDRPLVKDAPITYRSTCRSAPAPGSTFSRVRHRRHSGRRFPAAALPPEQLHKGRRVRVGLSEGRVSDSRPTVGLAAEA